LLLSAAGSSLAADGVIEINQARAVAGGVSPGDAMGFPVTLGASGSYRLTGNLTVSGANIPALLVTAPHVSIDLNGFSITGPAQCTVSPQTGATTGCTPPGSGAGISGSADDTSVAGGSIQGMAGNGIELGSNARIERMKITKNGSSGISASSGVIVRNSVARNGRNGIESGGVVSENEVSGNAGVGILSTGVVIGNAVLGNQGAARRSIRARASLATSSS
jgi:hypothetical protein